MTKTAGVVLILSGLGCAAFALSSEVARMGSDVARWVEEAKILPEAKVVAPAALPHPQPVPRRAAAPRPEAAPPASAPVIVTLAPRSTDAVASRTAAIPKDRDRLARELQKELRRVGCYEGEPNGVWTPATRRAMKTFTDRVNASLPVDEPDAVLFAMVQSQQDQVCGKPCPIDQGLSEDGRCLPNAILAKAASKPTPSAVATHAPASGGPAAGKPLPARSGWSATVTAARPTPSQALAVLAPAPATPPSTVGRMALAGPIDGHATTDPPLVAKPILRTTPPQRGPQVVRAPRQRTFVSTVFRHIDSRL